MTFKAEAIIIAVLLGLVAALGLQAAIYRGNAIDYKAQRDKATSALQLAHDTINDMQVRQLDVAALDAKYTGEIASAQKTIDGLRNDVTAGNVRLRIAIARAKQQAATGSVGDGETAELAESARQDYFRLREMIAKQESQVLYLQEYIQQQCLK